MGNALGACCATLAAKSFSEGGMPKVKVQDFTDVQRIREHVHAAAATAVGQLSSLAGEPLEVLHTLRFTEFGMHPTETRKLNFIEQLNQTFSVLVTLTAAESVFERIEGHGGLQLNLGTSSGRDVCGVSPDVIEVETIAAVSPSNNYKLKKDINRLQKSAAEYRWIFYYAPNARIDIWEERGITIRSLRLEEMLQGLK